MMDSKSASQEAIRRLTNIGELLFSAADAVHGAVEEWKMLLIAEDEGDGKVEVSPPADTELHAVELPTSPTVQAFTDATHSVIVQGEPVYSGDKAECQTFADNHLGGGGYGIAPITP